MSDDIAINANELGQRAALSGEEQEALQRLLCNFPRAVLAVLTDGTGDSGAACRSTSALLTRGAVKVFQCSAAARDGGLAEPTVLLIGEATAVVNELSALHTATASMGRSHPPLQPLIRPTQTLFAGALEAELERGRQQEAERMRTLRKARQQTKRAMRAQVSAAATTAATDADGDKDGDRHVDADDDVDDNAYDDVGGDTGADGDAETGACTSMDSNANTGGVDGNGRATYAADATVATDDATDTATAAAAGTAADTAAAIERHHKLTPDPTPAPPQSLKPATCPWPALLAVSFSSVSPKSSERVGVQPPHGTLRPRAAAAALRMVGCEWYNADFAATARRRANESAGKAAASDGSSASPSTASEAASGHRHGNNQDHSNVRHRVNAMAGGIKLSAPFELTTPARLSRMHTAQLRKLDPDDAQLRAQFEGNALDEPDKPQPQEHAAIDEEDEENEAAQAGDATAGGDDMDEFGEISAMAAARPPPPPPPRVETLEPRHPRRILHEIFHRTLYEVTAGSLRKVPINLFRYYLYPAAPATRAAVLAIQSLRADMRAMQCTDDDSEKAAQTINASCASANTNAQRGDGTKSDDVDAETSSWVTPALDATTGSLIDMAINQRRPLSHWFVAGMGTVTPLAEEEEVNGSSTSATGSLSCTWAPIEPRNINLLDTRNCRNERKSWPMVKYMCGRHAMREKVVMRKKFALPMSPREFFAAFEARTAPLIAVPDELGRNAGDDKSEQPVGIVHASNPEHAQTDMDAAVKAAAAAVAKAQKKKKLGRKKRRRSSAKAAQLILAGTGAENAAVSSAAARVMAEAWGCGIRGGVCHAARVDTSGTTWLLGWRRGRGTHGEPDQEETVKEKSSHQEVGSPARPVPPAPLPPRPRSPAAAAARATAEKVLRPGEGHVLHDLARALCSSWFDGCALCSEDELEVALELSHALMAAGSPGAGDDNASPGPNRGTATDLRAVPKLSPGVASLVQTMPYLRHAWHVAVQLSMYAGYYVQDSTGAAQWHLALLRNCLEALSVPHEEMNLAEPQENSELEAKTTPERAETKKTDQDARGPAFLGGTALPEGKKCYTQRWALGTALRCAAAFLDHVMRAGAAAELSAAGIGSGNAFAGAALIAGKDGNVSGGGTATGIALRRCSSAAAFPSFNTGFKWAALWGSGGAANAVPPEPIEDPVAAAAADDGSTLETRESLLLKQPRMVLTPCEAPHNDGGDSSAVDAKDLGLGGTDGDEEELRLEEMAKARRAVDDAMWRFRKRAATRRLFWRDEGIGTERARYAAAVRAATGFGQAGFGFGTELGFSVGRQTTDLPVLNKQAVPAGCSLVLGAAPGAQAWVLGCADRWPRLSAVPCPLTALPVPLTALCEHVAERDEGAAALAGESVRGAAGGGAVVAAEQEEIRRQQTDVMSGGTNNMPQQVCATTENYFGFDGDGNEWSDEVLCWASALRPGQRVLAFAREENLEKLHEGHPEADGDMIKAEALRTRLRRSILAQHSPLTLAGTVTPVATIEDHGAKNKKKKKTKNDKQRKKGGKDAGERGQQINDALSRAELAEDEESRFAAATAGCDTPQPLLPEALGLGGGGRKQSADRCGNAKGAVAMAFASAAAVPGAVAGPWPCHRQGLTLSPWEALRLFATRDKAHCSAASQGTGVTERALKKSLIELANKDPKMWSEDVLPSDKEFDRLFQQIGSDERREIRWPQIRRFLYVAGKLMPRIVEEKDEDEEAADAGGAADIFGDGERILRRWLCLRPLSMHPTPLFGGRAPAHSPNWLSMLLKICPAGAKQIIVDQGVEEPALAAEEPDDFEEDMDEAERAIPGTVSEESMCGQFATARAFFVRDSITTFSGAVGAGMTNAEATAAQDHEKMQRRGLIHQPLLLLGDRAAGKTTACRRLVLRWAQRALGTADAVVDARDPAWRRSRFWDGTDYATAAFMRYEKVYNFEYAQPTLDPKFAGQGPEAAATALAAAREADKKPTQRSEAAEKLAARKGEAESEAATSMRHAAAKARQLASARARRSYYREAMQAETVLLIDCKRWVAAVEWADAVRADAQADAEAATKALQAEGVLPAGIGPELRRAEAEIDLLEAFIQFEYGGGAEVEAVSHEEEIAEEAAAALADAHAESEEESAVQRLLAQQKHDGAQCKMQSESSPRAAQNEHQRDRHHRHKHKAEKSVSDLAKLTREQRSEYREHRRQKRARKRARTREKKRKRARLAAILSPTLRCTFLCRERARRRLVVIVDGIDRCGAYQPRIENYLSTVLALEARLLVLSTRHADDGAATRVAGNGAAAAFATKKACQAAASAVEKLVETEIAEAAAAAEVEHEAKLAAEFEAAQIGVHATPVIDGVNAPISSPPAAKCEKLGDTVGKCAINCQQLQRQCTRARASALAQVTATCTAQPGFDPVPFDLFGDIGVRVFELVPLTTAQQRQAGERYFDCIHGANGRRGLMHALALPPRHARTRGAFGNLSSSPFMLTALCSASVQLETPLRVRVKDVLPHRVLSAPAAASMLFDAIERDSNNTVPKTDSEQSTGMLHVMEAPSNGWLLSITRPELMHFMLHSMLQCTSLSQGQAVDIVPSTTLALVRCLALVAMTIHKSGRDGVSAAAVERAIDLQEMEQAVAHTVAVSISAEKLAQANARGAAAAKLAGEAAADAAAAEALSTARIVGDELRNAWANISRISRAGTFPLLKCAPSTQFAEPSKQSDEQPPAPWLVDKYPACTTEMFVFMHHTLQEYLCAFAVADTLTCVAETRIKPSISVTEGAPDSERKQAERAAENATTQANSICLNTAVDRQVRAMAPPRAPDAVQALAALQEEKGARLSAEGEHGDIDIEEKDESDLGADSDASSDADDLVTAMIAEATAADDEAKRKSEAYDDLDAEANADDPDALFESTWWHAPIELLCETSSPSAPATGSLLSVGKTGNSNARNTQLHFAAARGLSAATALPVLDAPALPRLGTREASLTILPPAMPVSPNLPPPLLAALAERLLRQAGQTMTLRCSTVDIGDGETRTLVELLRQHRELTELDLGASRMSGGGSGCTATQAQEADGAVLLARCIARSTTMNAVVLPRAGGGGKEGGDQKLGRCADPLPPAPGIARDALPIKQLKGAPGRAVQALSLADAGHGYLAAVVAGGLLTVGASGSKGASESDRNVTQSRSQPDDGESSVDAVDHMCDDDDEQPVAISTKIRLRAIDFSNNALANVWRDPNDWNSVAGEHRAVGMRVLGAALRNATGCGGAGGGLGGCVLATLRLSGCGLGMVQSHIKSNSGDDISEDQLLRDRFEGDSASLRELCSALRDCNTLTELDLSDNGIKPGGAVTIGAMLLCKKGAARHLHELKLSKNLIVTYHVTKGGKRVDSLREIDTVTSADPFAGTAPYDMKKQPGDSDGDDVHEIDESKYVPDLRGVEALALAVGGIDIIQAHRESARRANVALSSVVPGSDAAQRAANDLSTAVSKLRRIEHTLRHGISAIAKKSVHAPSCSVPKQAYVPGTWTPGAENDLCDVLDSSRAAGCSLRLLDLDRNALGVDGGLVLGASLNGSQRICALTLRACELCGVLPLSTPQTSEESEEKRDASGKGRRKRSAQVTQDSRHAGEYDGSGVIALCEGADVAAREGAMVEMDIRDNMVNIKNSRHARGVLSGHAKFKLLI